MTFLSLLSVSFCPANPATARATGRCPTSRIPWHSHSSLVNKLSYASSAWWGFASTDDQNYLKAFLQRSTKFSYRGNSTSTFTSLCDEVDEQLFDRVAYNTHHLLHPLLSPRHNRHYSFRQRTHDFELPDHTSELKNKNFLMRMLFKQRGCSTSLCISQS